MRAKVGEGGDEEVVAAHRLHAVRAREQHARDVALARLGVEGEQVPPVSVEAAWASDEVEKPCDEAVGASDQVALMIEELQGALAGGTINYVPCLL